MRGILAWAVPAPVANALATPAFAQDICEQLWVERNSIYKERGLLLQDRARDPLFRQWRLPL